MRNRPSPSCLGVTYYPSGVKLYQDAQVDMLLAEYANFSLSLCNDSARRGSYMFWICQQNLYNKIIIQQMDSKCCECIIRLKVDGLIAIDIPLNAVERRTLCCAAAQVQTNSTNQAAGTSRRGHSVITSTACAVPYGFLDSRKSNIPTIEYRHAPLTQ